MQQTIIDRVLEMSDGECEEFISLQGYQLHRMDGQLVSVSKRYVHIVPLSLRPENPEERTVDVYITGKPFTLKTAIKLSNTQNIVAQIMAKS